jgi:sensor c-di-GMP phosphodiesterase-like protein
MILCDSLWGNAADSWPQSAQSVVLSQGFNTLIGAQTPLFPEAPTLIFQNEKLSLMVNPDSVLEKSDYQSASVLFASSGEPVLLFGNDPVQLPAFSFYPFSSLYGFETCLSDYNVCLQTAQTGEQVWAQYHLIIAAKVLIDVLLLALSVFTVNAIQRFRLSERQRIKRALKSRQGFYFTRQPIVDLSTQTIKGYEVLTRFEDACGSMSPVQAMPHIRALKATEPFTFWMIESVLSEPSMQKLPAELLVHFNLFPEDLATLDIGRLQKLIRESKTKAKVCLEITEDFDFDVNAVLEQLQRLDEAGIPISVDDFGTGYSNLGKLGRLPIHTLKIDQSFVRGMERESLRASLIPEIISIAKRLGAEIIAEGVEHPDQAAMLLEMGVDMAQGWHFGRPERIGKDPSRASAEKSLGHSLTTGYNARNRWSTDQPMQ